MRLRAVFLALGLSLLLPAHAAAQDQPFSDCHSNELMRSDGWLTDPIPERSGAFRVRRTGSVVVVCGETTLQADEMTWETDTRLIHARGNVVFQQTDLRIYAERADIDGTTRLGTFYEAVGGARLGDEPEQKSLFGTLEPNVLFQAARIEKTAPDVYRITNGSFTTCMQATPRWEMSGSNGTITLNKYTLLTNVVLRVKGVPLFYMPVIYYPINKEDRATGFLLPSYGSSSVLGSSISNAFFWAINRSQDATFYHDLYTRGGQGIGSEYRYASAPGSEGRLNVHILNAPALLHGDGSVARAASRSYRIDGNASQELPHGFRLFGESRFFTDVATQQFHQDMNVSSARERIYRGTLTGSIRRARILATTEQRDFFFSAGSGQRSGRSPYASVTFSDSPIGRSLVYAGFWVEGGRVLRQDNLDDPATDRSLWRFDAAPTVRFPLSRLSFLSATASASWRLTHWFESRDPITGEQGPAGLTRQLLETRASVVGPVLSRVFQTPGSGYAERLKHLIEPGVTVQWTSPFEKFNQVVLNEQSIDAVVGGTMTVNYRLTNRLLARMAGGGAVREILSAEIGQSYYTDARAALFDPQYQQGGGAPTIRTGTFSPVRVEVTARPVDRASGNFRLEIDSRVHAVRNMWASGSLHGTYAQVNAGWSKRPVIPELPGFDHPDLASHFVNAGTTLRTRDNRLGGSYQVSYDVKRLTFQNQRVVAHYNSQCCGIAFDWQSRGAQLLGFASNQTWGVSFTLAGIGSFANPLGSFGGR